MTASTLIDSTLTAVELEAATILSWRCDELCRAGYGLEDALLLAITPHVDLHYATDLVAHGLIDRLAIASVLARQWSAPPREDGATGTPGGSAEAPVSDDHAERDDTASLRSRIAELEGEVAQLHGELARRKEQLELLAE